MNAHDSCHYHDIGDRKAEGKPVEPWEESLFLRLDDERRGEWEASFFNGTYGVPRPLMSRSDYSWQNGRI